MKITSLSLLAFLALPAVLSAADAPMMQPDAETMPKQKIVSLTIEPAKVSLDGKFAAAQVIVFAKLQSGEVADVTRLATLKLGGDCAGVSKSGHIEAHKNGAATLNVELSGQKASAAIEVGGVVENAVVDFIRDVNPVMTKLGCNAGTCHGAKEGKYGFKLSLRGYDPIFDVRSLKDDLASRRLNAASPDDSLMLLKATAGVPHEGGQRTKLGEKYYEILRAWIADGAKLDLGAQRVKSIEVFPKNPVVPEPGARQQFRVVATFADGKMRDVTAEAFVDSGNGDVAAAIPETNALINTLRRGEAPVLARYEGNYAATTLTVMGDRSGFAWKQPETWGRVDELVAAKWQRMKIEPSGVCGDADFLRRVYLDLTGQPPTAEELRAFLAEEKPLREKRDAVIDRLIGSPEFVEHATNKWCDLLQVNSKFLGAQGVQLFRDWIRKEIADNTPYDQFVRKIVTASGSNKENPAASYWKILRDPSETMENTTHLFLATRFNCNKCHDHPFERWTQDQYYHLGAFFSQVSFADDPAAGGAKLLGTAVEKPRALFEIVKDQAAGEMIHLRTNKVAEPTFPFPAKLEVPVHTDKPFTRREQLAAWITSTDNRYFASSYVNRQWGYLLGAGIIEPLDDIRAGNPATNPELLEYLTKEFVAHGFDVRHVLRTICKSRTYQLALATNKWNEDDKTNYSHALARRLPAEVLYDSVLKVTGAGSRLPGGVRAGMLADSQSDLPSGFLANAGRPARESSCECERSSDLRLGSVMALLSGPAIADAIGDPSNALPKLVAAQPDDRRLIDEIFVRVLSRPAGEAEIARTLEAWAGIEQENKDLLASLDAKEKELAPAIAKQEAERAAAIAAAKAELTRYEKEAAPKIADAEKKRIESVAVADKAVKEYEQTKLAAAQVNFETTVPIAKTYTGWVPLDLVEPKATGGVELTKQPDGTIRASGGAAKSTDYTVVADTMLAGITGVMIEVLPDANAAAFGPGFAAGNFVLGEISLKTGAFGSKKQIDDAKFNGAAADFSQATFEVAKAVDDKKGDGNNGWAVASQAGVPHYAAFALAKPIGDAKGLRLRFELNQPRAAGFNIARFRLYVTTGTSPLSIGLPIAVTEALKKPASFRSKDEIAAITAYWKDNDPDLVKRRLTLAKNEMPLPTDPGIVERRGALAKSEDPIRIDPKLAQLRADAEQSKTQNANRRLTGSQDLVWALVNTPAFLFNR